MKQCWRCQELKSFDAFYRDASRGDGFGPECKSCKTGSVRVYRVANIDKVRKWNNEWGKQNRDKRNAWFRAHPEHGRARRDAHRAKLKGAEGSHTGQQWLARLEYFGSQCWMCGNEGKMTKDHVMPLSKGGTDWASNLRPACQSCNSSKGNRSLKRNPV